VPILVGSFQDLMEAGREPIEEDSVGRFVSALGEVEATYPQRVAYIGGIDLCHVGPQFGDPAPVDATLRDAVRRFDAQLLDRAVALDPRGWFATAAAIHDRWRVCGLAATYTMMHVLGPASGALLSYDQAVDPQGSCCVSFASVAYHAD
jgi:hypothetical protein